MILITFKANSIFLCLLLHLSELTNDMHATMIAGMNSHKSMIISHINIKSATISPVKHKARNNTQMYCIIIQAGLLLSFIVRNLWLCFIRCGLMIYAKL